MAFKPLNLSSCVRHTVQAFLGPSDFVPSDRKGARVDVQSCRAERTVEKRNCEILRRLRNSDDFGYQKPGPFPGFPHIASRKRTWCGNVRLRSASLIALAASVC